MLLVLALGAGLILVTLDRGEGEASGGLPRLRVDPNVVPERVLIALPQLGPARAAAIVEARQEGPFRSLGDLEARVRGIGPATAAVLAPHLRFPLADARSDDPLAP